MADEDIDIEEHDVLDNPVIRSIFPDITVIKKEISQYYEDVPEIKPDPESTHKYESKTKEGIVSTTASKDIRNDHRNPCPLVDIVDISYFDNIEKIPELEQSNKIILGSKPSTNLLTTNVLTNKGEEKDNTTGHTNNQRNVDSTIRVPKVFLQDLGNYIYRSNRYCKDCVTLFPSKLHLANHKRKVHSMIATKTPLSLSESILQTPKTVPQKNKCNICNTDFSTNASLSRHYKNVHKKNYVTLKKDTYKSGLSQTKRNLTKKQSDALKHVNSNMHLNKSSLEQKRNKCSVCASTFSCKGNLSRHYKNVHQKNVTFKSNNKNKKTTSYKKKKYINKITRSQKRRMASQTSNACFHCKETFPDSKSLIDHIYEVLEPKSLSKQQSNKNISRKATLQTSRQGSVKSQTEQVQNSHVGKSMRDKLIYENQDSDDNCSDHVESEEDDENIDLETRKYNIRNKGKVSKIRQQKKASTIKPVFSDSENFDAEENNGNENLETKVSHSKYRNFSGSIEIDESDEDRNKNREMIREKALSGKKLKHVQSKMNSEKNDLISKRDQNKFTSLKRKNSQENLLLNSGEKKHASKAQSSKNKEIPNTTENEHSKAKKRQHMDESEISPSSSSCDEFGGSKTNSKSTHKIKVGMVYECVYCSYMLLTVRSYYNHVRRKHRIVNLNTVNKVNFYDQCKYCPSKNKNVPAHNLHLYKYHNSLVYKHFPNKITMERGLRLKNPMFRMFESFVLESIIYKCNKCDVHFSSSYIAKDHEQHMELLINWKCSKCGRIFKKHDKYLHLKQHTFSKSLNVFQFTESELARLLYNCTKCAIHFTEDRYLEHFSKCGVEATDSVYCKKCDILIDKCGYKNHESYHKSGENVNDFTFVAANIIDVAKNNEAVVERKRKRLYEQINCYTFCPTCKCFLTDIGLSRKTHIEARCSQIPKYVCNLCGLILTNVSLKSHRNRHRKDKGLNLKSFKFFNLKGIQINPPVPEYPSCTNCDVCFVSKNAVKSHICVETDSLNCNICNIKLSENAFKLHMQFHNYGMLTNKKQKPQDPPSAKIQGLLASSLSENETAQGISSEIYEHQINAKVPVNNTITSLSSSSETSPHSVNHTSTDNRRYDTIMYSCQYCKITVDVYDKVIEHCQKHFSSTSQSCIASKICTKCSMHIETDAYDEHQTFHLSCDTIQYYTFDPAYFTCDNDTWTQHVFANASVRKEILRESIYKHECRIKMEIIQKGPLDLTVYKCDKCGNFIDPDCLFAHVKNCCRKSIRKHPCPFCGLPFMSSNFRLKHEEIHKRYNSIRIKSYNMVLINRETHSTYTDSIISAVNQWVLYLCRACDGVVDNLQRVVHQCNFDTLRKCSICKLLIHRANLENHVSKHDNENTSNMKLILFGNKEESSLKKIVSPSFRGIVCDYTLYKCAQCEICVNEEIFVSNHICRSVDSKLQCHMCSFYIAPESLKEHIDMHYTHLEFRTENIRIVTFDASKCDNHIPTIEETGDETSDINNGKEQESHDEYDAITPPLKSIGTNTADNIACSAIINETKVNTSVKLYKCTCGLHYSDELNAKSCCKAKGKVLRQICTKCSLAFNPKELFSHLIAHHGDKNKTFKYDIIEVPPENESEVKES